MKLHTLLIISSTCLPLFASTDSQHMTLVCLEGDNKAHYVLNDDGSPKVVTGNFEIDNEKFEKAHAEYENAIAQYEIFSKQVDEENARNLKEKERIFREIDEQYAREVAQWRKNELLSHLRKFGGAAVPFFGAALSVYTFVKFPPLAVLAGTYTYVHLKVAYTKYVPELPTLPYPAKKGGSYPAEIGIAPPPREPKRSEIRFRVFVVRSIDKKTKLCGASEARGAQDVATGYVYPLKMQD